MSAVETPQTKPKATLLKEAYILFFVAAHSHNLAEQFGVELNPDGQGFTLIDGVPRPWLCKHPGRENELTFDPDAYAKTINNCSDYTRHMRLFILNVWNPGYARSKGWHFDLFSALRGLDSGNCGALAWWLKHPIFP